METVTATGQDFGRRPFVVSNTRRAPRRRRRVAFYSHDTMGLGHTRRNLLIAEQLLAADADADILMIAGMRQTSAFPIPPRMDFVTLPALYKDDHGQYEARNLQLSLNELLGLRTSLIMAALRGFDPDLLVVDNVPRGAVRELDAALAVLRTAGRPRCVLGLRDTLDDAESVKQEWGKLDNARVIADYYDAIWVYGDPAVYDLRREYGFSPALCAMTHFTGYLDPRVRRESAPSDAAALAQLGLPNEPFVLCQVGGGQDGAHLVETFLSTPRPAGMHGVVLTGPFIPRDILARARAQADPRMHVLEFVAEPAVLLRRAQKVIAMGGYNTACELLTCGKPALMVPRVKPRQEQLVRAQRWSELGLVEMLSPDAATPARLGEWIASGPAANLSARARVDLGGLKRLPRLMMQLLDDGEGLRATSSEDE
ncbi:MAG TPA: glycosyltransferase [Candidatus Binataceae bacterium]|nr:glycosyltransferase [Candidatus Binataceae bacterium]